MNRRDRRDLVTELNGAAEAIAAQFGLRYRAIEADRANATSRYGVCYSDGTIRIRLVHATTGRPLKHSSLVNTLCHELAHLRHFNHGPRFKRFYLEILAFARARGIYRPGPVAGARTAPPRRVAARPDAPRRPAPSPPLGQVAGGPVQLGLFGDR